jgi:gliding motility-associated-like protein
MRLNYLYILLCLFVATHIAAQNEANIWYFGNNAGLDFNSGSPLALTDGALQTEEGCASISNANGELLFYTDGTTVWNKNHVAMLNGTGLNGSFSSTQSAIIVPKPNSSTIYYIFTVDALGQANGLQYSEVDMTLDSGLGGITSTKNILLHTPVVEKLTAVEHSNGTDIWVVVHENGSANFRSYLVTSTGVQSNPTITNIGYTYSGTDYDDNGGYMKLSPDGTRLAMAFPKSSNGLQLFDFDNTTGVISNQLDFFELTGASRPYGIEFSPSGDLLYISGSGGVMQLDLTLDTAFDISFNAVILVNNPFFSRWGAAQLASDGKIYITNLPFENFPPLNALSVINNPDTLGIGCDFQQDVIPLGTGIAQRGLPPFIQSFFNVKISVEDNCFGNATQFTYDSSSIPDSIFWDFGDGTTSSLENPSHTYAAPGNYTVSVTVTSNGETKIATEDITIYEQPVANPIPDQIGCVESPFFTYTYDVTIHDSDILNGQDPNQFSLEYFATIEDYNNDNPLFDPQMIELMVGGSADFVVSVSNTENEECSDFTIIHVDVLQSPGINSNLPELSYCDDDSVGSNTDGLVILDLTTIEIDLLDDGPSTDVIVSYYLDENYANIINDPENYQNSNPSETIYVEAFFNTEPVCTSRTAFDIFIQSASVLNTSVSITKCDDDTDGISLFNLSDAYPQLSSNYQNESFDFYTSQNDAENAINEISTPNAYQNQNQTEILWVRVQNNIGCTSITQITLNVTTSQIPNDFMLDFFECEINHESGVSTFDFSSAENDILSLFPNSQNLNISFYETENDALLEINAIQDISNYQNTNSPTTQNIYVRIDDAINNDCTGLGHHITLHSEPIPAAIGPFIYEKCDDGGDGIEFFDTSGIDSTLSSLQSEPISITYVDEFGTSLPSPLPNPIEVDIPIYNVFATMTFDNPNVENGVCSTTTTVSFGILNASNNIPPDPFIACDEDCDGVFTFDTSDLEENMIPDADESITIVYEDVEGNIIQSPFPASFSTSTQTVTAYITSDNGVNGECTDVISIEFVVTQQPTANSVEGLSICDDSSNDGIENINLSDFNDDVLGDQNSDVFEILYYENQSDAENTINPLPNDFQVSDSNQSLFVRIQHLENQNCFDISSFDIDLNDLPTANTPEKLIICDAEGNDQIDTFDLTVQDSSILNEQSAENFSISYHTTLADAENSLNAINGLYTNANNPQTLYARIENVNGPGCYSTTSFDIEVFDSPVIDIPSEVYLCENESVVLSIENIYDDYLWSTGETTSEISISEPGTYDVSVFTNYENFSCEATTTFEVIASNEAAINELSLVDWTQSNNAIRIFVEGNGDYEYSIDGVNYQDSSTFQNLTNFEYLVHIRDKNGCGEILRRVYLLDYPQFFTPNGDGFNDRWQIINAKQEIFTKIYIFDRYGKLVADLHPGSNGWDGTFNGNPMPANDYWFKVEREDGRIHTGHFTLKR